MLHEQNGLNSGNYVLPSLSATGHGSLRINDVDDEVQSADSVLSKIADLVQLNSMYELSHIHLPPRASVHLRSIRVAMVTEKSLGNIVVRFPSMISLEKYLGNSMRSGICPELDEMFVMGTVVASKVLHRRVSSQEFTEKQHLQSFWRVQVKAGTSVDMMEEDSQLEKSTCLAEIKCKGMIRWGIRRQVKFLEGHQLEENKKVVDKKASSSKPEARKMQSLLDEGDHEPKEEQDEDISGQEYTVMEENCGAENNLKGKRYKLRSNGHRLISARKAKFKKKRLKKNYGLHGNQQQGRSNCRELLVLENPKDRWSAERYRRATKNLMDVMKSKGATATNPILRPDLRAEARKMIGDTGLLDHLLKHMAGKLAPGGADRFRRRHNADGAMEYWLESAELVNIRKEAGVDDPYWIPPFGWTPGDCPTQDPVCAKELRLLKDKISGLERNFEEMVPRKQYEEDIVKLRREIMEQGVSCQKLKENEATDQAHSNLSFTSQILGQLGDSMKSSRTGLEELLHPMGKHEEQLMIISDNVKGIEREIKKLMTSLEGKRKPKSTLMVSKKKCAENGEEVTWVGGQEVMGTRGEGGSTKRKAEKTTTGETKKAANIERRKKSGFRICKPEGTFIWPNMATTAASNGSSSHHQVVVKVEDLLPLVPTPPSISSSSDLSPLIEMPCQHSLVKPVAERRAITVTISAMSNDQAE